MPTERLTTASGAFFWVYLGGCVVEARSGRIEGPVVREGAATKNTHYSRYHEPPKTASNPAAMRVAVIAVHAANRLSNDSHQVLARVAAVVLVIAN